MTFGISMKNNHFSSQLMTIGRKCLRPTDKKNVLWGVVTKRWTLGGPHKGSIISTPITGSDTSREMWNIAKFRPNHLSLSRDDGPRVYTGVPVQVFTL